jgi:hypothetical protein
MGKKSSMHDSHDMEAEVVPKKKDKTPVKKQIAQIEKTSIPKKPKQERQLEVQSSGSHQTQTTASTHVSK